MKKYFIFAVLAVALLIPSAVFAQTAPLCPNGNTIANNCTVPSGVVSGPMVVTNTSAVIGVPIIMNNNTVGYNVTYSFTLSNVSNNDLFVSTNPGVLATQWVTGGSMTPNLSQIQTVSPSVFSGDVYGVAYMVPAGTSRKFTLVGTIQAPWQILTVTLKITGIHYGNGGANGTGANQNAQYVVSSGLENLSLTASFDSSVTPKPIYSDVTVSVTETPSLALTYDSAHNESQLRATVYVKITAGPVPVKIFSGMAWFPLIDSKGSGDNLNGSAVSVTSSSNLVSGVDTYSRPYLTVPANKSATFKVVRTANPQQMFAGAYVASLKSLYYDNSAQPGSSMILDLPVNKSYAITIIGEKSPYITSITQPVKAGATVTVIGARLNYIASVLVDGGYEPLVLTKSTDGTRFSFSAPAWLDGQHYLEVSNNYGKSNRVGFTVTGNVMALPIVSIVNTPTLKLTYDSKQNESSLVADATIKVTAGSSDVPIGGNNYLNFVSLSVGKDAGETLVDNESTVYTLLSSPNSPGASYIPAGTSATFRIVRTMSPQQMFAGTYVAWVRTWINNTASAVGDKSNAITIVGEKSPYITSITQSVKAGDTFDIYGVRLDWSGLLIDGRANEPFGLNGSADGTKVYFTVPAAWTGGSHSIEVSNSYGKSNKIFFTMTGNVVPVPAVQSSITIINVQYSPASPKVNDLITTNVTIINNGPTNQNSLFKVNVQGTTVTVPSLAAGEVRTVTVPNAFTFTYPGTQTLNTSIIYPIVGSGGSGNTGDVFTNTITFTAADPTTPPVVVPTPPVATSTPPSLTLTATPTTIKLGAATQLTWSATNATSCFKSGGWSQENIALSGSQSIGPAKTTTYTITCKNESGVTATKSVTVVVGSATRSLLSASALDAVNDQGNGVSAVAPAGATQNSSCVALANDLQYRDNDTLNAGAVSELQGFLQNQGFLSSELTGYFGNQTFSAVKSFQTEKGLKTSGYVGALTRAKIQEVSCQ